MMGVPLSALRKLVAMPVSADVEEHYWQRVSLSEGPHNLKMRTA
jgi:hypothetical protein